MTLRPDPLLVVDLLDKQNRILVRLDATLHLHLRTPPRQLLLQALRDLLHVRCVNVGKQLILSPTDNKSHQLPFPNTLSSSTLRPMTSEPLCKEVTREHPDLRFPTSDRIEITAGATGRQGQSTAWAQEQLGRATCGPHRSSSAGQAGRPEPQQNSTTDRCP